MIEHVVFLLEEPSAQDFLQAILPSLIPEDIQIHFLVFEGKQDLEKQLTRRLKAWLRPNTKFIVMRDQDSGDCVAIKQRLRNLCLEAKRPDATIRIACRELEAFFIGDWQAVANAYGKPRVAELDGKAKYRDPDRFGSPSRELASVIDGYQKRDGARRISVHLKPENNRSASFQVLFRTLSKLSEHT